ncbi:MAG: T9SS type A sorting domain-containing protein, partial [Sphingobacteriia bacterium]|nr:T9SS type A sorting domain-containing protein [Sphingobacteriia bacterium]
VTFGADFSSDTQRFIRIFFNNYGTFGEYKDFTLNMTNPFTYIDYGNVNEDEFPDILVLSNQFQFWGILYNDGAGNLSEPEYYDVTGDLPHRMTSYDFDGNGREDVVITGQNTRIYYSKPEGFETVLLETNYPKKEVYLVDFDNDGDMDIITFGCFWGYTYATFFENTGNQTFVSHTDFIFQNITSGNAVADFNNDSLPDILFYSDSNNEFLLFYNKGNFQMGSMIDFYPVTLISKYIVCADFDGNGYQDIAYATNGYVEILFNDGEGNFQNDPVVGLTDKSKPPDNISISPNPFHDHTTLAITLHETGIAEVSVYDIPGRKIKCITHQQMKGGETYRFTWDGTGANQQKCRPGIYLVSLEVNGKQRQTGRVIIN